MTRTAERKPAVGHESAKPAARGEVTSNRRNLHCEISSWNVDPSSRTTRVVIETAGQRVAKGMRVVILGLEHPPFTIVAVTGGYAVGRIESDVIDHELDAHRRVIVNPSADMAAGAAVATPRNRRQGQTHLPSGPGIVDPAGTSGVGGSPR